MPPAPSRAPSRRWFAYSLRTLFVVVTLVGTVLSCLVWNVRCVNERDRMIEWADANHLSHGLMPLPPSVPKQRLPIMWRLLGARRVDAFCFDKPVRASDQQRLKAAFPEAIIVDYLKMCPSPPYTWSTALVPEIPR